jgi:cytidylate kinase
MSARVVAIDGAAGSGKSTLARGLAAALDVPYVNTGLMYRAVAASALVAGVDVDDEAGLSDLAARLRFTVEGDPPELEVEGWRVDALTTPAVEETVSAVARHPEVRSILRRVQRQMGAGGAVMEGRDIGSVVFPDAVVKLFLRASADQRSARRAAERDAHGDAAREAVVERDRRDAATNPLDPVADAVVLDTGLLGIEDTLEEALRIVRSRAAGLFG